MENPQPPAHATDDPQPTLANAAVPANPAMSKPSPPISKVAPSKETPPKQSVERATAAVRSAIGRPSRAASVSRHAMRNPKPSANSKTRDLFQVLAMSVISMAVTLAAMWSFDLLSSGSWEGHSPNRVIFTGVGLSIAREQLRTPTPLMPPTVVVFYSENCLHCVKMRSPFLRASNEFKTARFVAAKLAKDHDKNVQLAKSFGVTHVPTVFFTKTGLDNQGKLRVQHVKYTGGAQLWDLRKFIKAQLEQAGEPPQPENLADGEKEL